MKDVAPQTVARPDVRLFMLRFNSSVRYDIVVIGFHYGHGLIKILLI